MTTLALAPWADEDEWEPLYGPALNGSGRPARWHDFSALAAGRRKRSGPTIFPRADGQFMFYAGKEHSIYGEAESGKDMLLVAIVAWCLANGISVMWVDFEEGDEIEIGSRLLNHGVETRLLTDPDMFRYATPEDSSQANCCLRDILRWKPGVAIWDGVSAAFGVFGWLLKENDSAIQFRSTLIRPCIARRIATISTDHVPKESEGGRYAIGGVMKLNMVNGASYLTEVAEPIMIGRNGASRVYLTKDRPSGVKPSCAKAKGKPSSMLYAGTMVVRSAGTSRGALGIEFVPPVSGGMPTEKEIPGADVDPILLEKLSKEYEKVGPDGIAPSNIRDAWDGPGKKKVMIASAHLKTAGYLAGGTKTNRGQRLVSVKPFRADDPLKVGK